eukprot:GHVQ01006047.1.p1 GENE.GHVQ01006047.1~~GHVQ01006047.1.p1  ORF type:complete len:158 (-),score=35.51 GHVQ01006047.1:235-708(-)
MPLPPEVVVRAHNDKIRDWEACRENEQRGIINEEKSSERRSLAADGTDIIEYVRDMRGVNVAIGCVREEGGGMRRVDKTKTCMGEDVEEREEMGGEKWMGEIVVGQVPWCFVVLGFAGTAISYADRSNIAVAIISMAQELDWDKSYQGAILSSFYVG